YSNSEHLTEACQQADLIIAIGEDFGAMSTRALRAELAGKLIQITPYQEEIGRICPSKKGYVASPTNFIKAIADIKKSWATIPQKLENESITNSYLKVLSNEIQFPVTYFGDVGNAGYASITELTLSAGQKFY